MMADAKKEAPNIPKEAKAMVGSFVVNKEDAAGRYRYTSKKYNPGFLGFVTSAGNATEKDLPEVSTGEHECITVIVVMGEFRVGYAFPAITEHFRIEDPEEIPVELVPYTKHPVVGAQIDKSGNHPLGEGCGMIPEFLKSCYKYNLTPATLLNGGYYKKDGYIYDMRPYLKRYIYCRNGEWREGFAPTMKHLAKAIGKFDEAAEIPVAKSLEHYVHVPFRDLEVVDKGGKKK